jgi:sterol desaturase/sphingolipid hydroxylase (fatty acid hydroxylase superfamily)
MLWERNWWYALALAFAVIALAETFLPFRSLPSSTPRRWISNAVLLIVSNATLICAFRLSGIALAITIRAASHGVLNRVAIPYSVQFAIGFAALDLANYVSHRLLHAVALMWSVHQVHHTETDIDLTTGFRFHPVEALFSQALALITIALLGPPPGAAAFAALAVTFQAFFDHGNLRIPETTDRILRWLIITPDMHRVHHSEELLEQNANFGAILSLWDRMFGTYLAGQASALTRYGLVELANGSELSGAQLLTLPFQRARSEVNKHPALPAPNVLSSTPRDGAS